MKKLRLLILLCFLLTVSRGNAQTIQTDTKMSSSQKRKLLAFVQDIVSAGIGKDFKKGALPNQELIQFGIDQVALHRIHLFHDGKKEGEARLAAKYVSNAVAEYFGKTIKHQSIEDWKYKNGYYNGSYDLFEQLGLEPIKRLQVHHLGKSHLIVYVDYIDSMASAALNKDFVVKTRMALERVSAKGKSHYILTAYKSLSPRP